MSGHLKRLTVPKTWTIHKKEDKWVSKPNCGGYALDESVPLVTIIRDYLNYADNSKEAKRIIHAGKILVDGKIRNDPKFGVGLMSVISIPLRKEHFRAVVNKKGRFEFVKIPTTESKKKLCKIVGKKIIKGGITQLQFHDGRTLIAEGSNGYKISDTLILELPSQKILGHIPLKRGSLALVMHGHNIGKICTLRKIEETKGSPTHIAVLKDKTKAEILTLKDYLFCVGETKPEITMGS